MAPRHSWEPYALHQQSSADVWGFDMIANLLACNVDRDDLGGDGGDYHSRMIVADLVVVGQEICTSRTPSIR